MTDQERIENLEKENAEIRERASAWRKACKSELETVRILMNENATLEHQRNTWKERSEMYEHLCNRYAEKYGTLVNDEPASEYLGLDG